MRYAFAALLTIAPVLLATHGRHTGNDMITFLAGLIALAPTFAILLLKRVGHGHQD